MRILKLFISGLVLVAVQGYCADAVVKKPAAEKLAAAEKLVVEKSAAERIVPDNKKEEIIADGVHKDVIFKDEVEKFSYTAGYDIGNNFKKQNVIISPELLYRGLKDALSGADMQLTKEEMIKTMGKFQEKMLEKRKKEITELLARNKQIGEEFLKENAKKEGVKTTESGLQYKSIEQGQGASPTDNDFVEVEYTGRLINGTIFDSTDKNGMPATLALNGVIPGWQEALKMMKVGDKWEIYVPSKLAYGERILGGLMEPNSTLIFEIKLLSIKKKDKEPPL